MARSDSYQVLLLCNLIATSVWIAANYKTSCAIEQPHHLSICVLLLCSLSWFTLKHVCPISKEANQTAEYDSSNLSKIQTPIDEGPYAESLSLQQIFRYLVDLIRQFRPISVFLVPCIVSRVVIFRSTVHDVQCSWDGAEIFLPLLLCLLELLELLRKNHQRASNPQFKSVTKATNSYYFRYMLLITVWVLTVYGTISISATHSTYVCPQANKRGNAIHLLQVLGLILDTCIIHLVSKLSMDAKASSKTWDVLSRLAFATAGILAIITFLLLCGNQQYLAWFFQLDSKTILSLIFSSLLCTNFIVSTVYLMGEIRCTTIVFITSCVVVFVYHWFSLNSDFTVSSRRASTLTCLGAFVTTFGLFRLEREASKIQQLFSLSQNSSRTLIVLFMLSSTAFFAKKFLVYSTSSDFSAHPITGLISNARSTSIYWEKQAAKSRSLQEAVVEYQSRYEIPPPPNFDKWYEYATKRRSLVIDDFGQINNDLLPFWGMKPADIRDMTRHMAEKPWTEIAVVRIFSNGTTALGPHIPSTHRWMVEEIANMINNFVEWLPEMDIGFNINDESRVAVPWGEIEDLKDEARLSRDQLNQTKALRSFSSVIPELWNGSFMNPEPPYAPHIASKYFKEASLDSSFDHYGVVGCPPDSLSRKYKWWNKKSFCHECVTPHSIGPILANWSLSGSLCHQPDLASLHGFHLSPSAFKPTTKLFPIFSQSKFPTFNDIVYPSAWNYIDKVVRNASRDMPYSDKERTLFWRGATSEGYSIRGTWQGMQRQRFVHMVNYTKGDDTVNLLLANKRNRMGYTQQRTKVSQITSVTNINVSFVDKPTRCAGSDCDAELSEFSFGPSVDFQDHWKYKYLFDLDGAGFSGRFLPFLESRSLTFRSAGFRQWFEERLTAWNHFVPVDSRLHGIWHLIAYFGGTEKGGANAHDVEGERIAEAGKEWAEKVLRKEDMDIYMFRLLLEWGRVVDDRREELGFVLP